MRIIDPMQKQEPKYDEKGKKKKKKGKRNKEDKKKCAIF